MSLKVKNKELIAKIMLVVAILGGILCGGIIFFDIYSGKSTFSDQIKNIIALIAVMIYGIYIYSKSVNKRKK